MKLLIEVHMVESTSAVEPGLIGQAVFFKQLGTGIWHYSGAFFGTDAELKELISAMMDLDDVEVKHVRGEGRKILQRYRVLGGR